MLLQYVIVLDERSSVPTSNLATNSFELLHSKHVLHDFNSETSVPSAMRRNSTGDVVEHQSRNLYLSVPVKAIYALTEKRPPKICSLFS